MIQNQKHQNSPQKKIPTTKSIQRRTTDLNESAKYIYNQYNQAKKETEEPKQQDSCLMKPIRFLLDFFEIYKFGDSKDKGLMFFGTILALCSGVSIPLFMYFWGKQIDHTITRYFVLSSQLDISLNYYLAYIGLALGTFLIDGVIFALWKILSERVAYQFRIKYMQSFVKRKIGWVDQQNLYETSSKFKLNCLTIEKATGDKVALFYNLNGAILSGAIAAICVRWTFALFLLAIIPLGLGAMGYFIYVLIMRKIETKSFFEKAEGQAIEAVCHIKTVKSLGAQKFQEETYQKKLQEYQQQIKSYPLKLGIATGLFYFIQYFYFGIGYMFGIQCIKGSPACPVSMTGSHYSIGDLHIVFFQVYACTYFFLQIASNFDAIRDSIKASKEIFKFVQQAEQQFYQGQHTQEGVSLEDTAAGDIQFKNVVFTYPTNKTRRVLRGLTFKPLKNKFNAIVGTTGSGKSTIAQLLLKFYTPNDGQIFVGGTDITQVSSAWLRDRVGFVGQQPTLFSGTLRDNIAVGKANATDKEIWEVLKQVNMQEFVKRLPEKLNYDVGFGGQKLSGGQKQRIAIARALIKNPQLLILDEATSALDRKSQKLVQKTFQSIFLNKNLNMTVICIAHRVRTIVKAHRIFYIQSGAIKEEGLFREINCFKDIELPPEEEIHEEEEFLQDLHFSSRIIDYQQKLAPVEEEFQGNIYSKLLEYTQQKFWYVVSLFMAFLSGVNHPVAILILAYMYNEEIHLMFNGGLYDWCSLGFPSNCNDILDGHHNQALKFLGGVVAFAIYTFFPFFIQINLTTKIEEQINHNLRKSVFSKLMLMPVPWYEKPEYEGGQAASKFATDVKQASTLVSNYIPILITNFTSIITGIVICIVYLWQVGLLSLFSIPLIAIGGCITMYFIGGYDDQTLHRYDDSDKVATEIMVCIKTVAALNYQKRLIQKYASMIQVNLIESIKRGAKIGFFFGFAMFIILITIGSAMYANDNIISKINVEEKLDIMVAMTVPMWCGWVAGNSFFFISHAAAGKKSAAKVFKLLEDKTEAQVQKQKAIGDYRPQPNEIKGRIEFIGVSFRYIPQGKYVLKDINLVIEAGQKAAFVGESGCGKSTIMLLLQRFYDFEGVITLDGVDIFDYDLASYRSYFSVLNQEPILFTGTVRENVNFGGQADTEELRQACKLTFAYDVNRAWKGAVPIEKNITEFLDRDTGVKGSKVSGGEKQRIACARAVLKKPRIFLMDEGTSALDRETEKRVQQNIDKKLKGITTVTVAHRLETIENSDIIFLVEDGKIVERGKYKEMMERKQHFFRFVQGETFKTIGQITDFMLTKLIYRLLGVKGHHKND